MANKSQKFRDNLVHYAIYSIIGFILLSTILSFWNRYVTYDTTAIIKKAQETKSLTTAIQEKIITEIELGVTGYLVTGNESKLARLAMASKKKDSIFKHLERNLREEGYEPTGLKEIASAVDDYQKKANEIVKHAKESKPSDLNDVSVTLVFTGDGSYNTFKDSVFKFASTIEESAKSDYEWSIVDNAIIQIILVLLSVPILIIASRKLGMEVRNSHTLLSSLAANNKKYLYDDGEESQINAKSVVEKSIESFKRAFDFVEHVAKGKFDQAQVLLPEAVRSRNKSTLMGALLEMSSKLRESEEADQKRQWISSGLNEFYEIVRNNQTDTKSLADKVVSFLTRYLKSQQGSLFTLRKDSDQEYLCLDACFAYNRKKWIEKRIEIGEGVLGQAFLEGETVLMTQIPDGYTSITSGLGDATPSCLLIEPFRYNDKIEAIFEIAGFTKYQPHHMEFLKKAGEILAAALNSVKNNSEMQALLNQSREQAEALRSQEEELRQNMEELEATNESMRRRENA